MNNKEKGIAIKLSSLEHNVLPMPRLYGGWTVRTLSANMKYIELALESLLFDYGFRPIIIEVQTGFTPKTSEILYHQLDNFFCQIEFLKNDLRNKKISIGNLLTSENMKEYVTLTWTDSDALGSAPDDGKHISIDTPLREIMDIVEEEILEYTKPDENISNLSENKKEIEPTIFTYLQGHLGWFPMDIYPSKIDDKKVSWVFYGNLEEQQQQKQSGKWLLFIPPKYIDECWGKIIKGVDSGNILCAKTTSATKVTKGCYATMIYTKNYQDKEDIARVLEYLTSVGLKDKKTIYYKSDEQTRLGKKDSLYSSDDF